MPENGKETSSRQSLRCELAVCFGKLQNRGFFFGLLLPWVCLFHFVGNSTFGYFQTNSLFRWMYEAYNSPGADDGHGLLIPFAVFYLLWWKRGILMALPQKIWWPGVFVLLGATLLHVLGYAAQQPRFSIIAFFWGFYGLIGLAWGWKLLKGTFFPFVLFIFCVPVGTLEIMKTITLPLRLFSTYLTTGILNGIFDFGIIRRGTQIFDETASYSYDVNAACSGIRGVFSLFVLMLIYGVITFTNMRKRVGIAVLAVPIAIAANVLRLFSIVMTAELFGQKAGDFVHEWSGFFTYALAIACALLIGRWWREPDQMPVRADLQTA